MTTSAKPAAEKTYTLTLNESDMAHVIQALTIDGETLRALAAEYEGDPSTNYAAALAEASEALRTRFAETVKPPRDPLAHVPTDERWAAVPVQHR